MSEQKHEAVIRKLEEAGANQKCPVCDEQIEMLVTKGVYLDELCGTCKKCHLLALYHFYHTGLAESLGK